MKEGTIKRIHVNQHVIRSNAREGHNEPPLRVKTSKANLAGREVIIDGRAKVVYNPEKPLSCGARVWIETRAPVEILGGPESPIALC